MLDIIVLVLDGARVRQLNNYYAKVIMIEWWNKRFEAKIIRLFLEARRAERNKSLLPVNVVNWGNRILWPRPKAEVNKIRLFAENLLFHHEIIMTFA